MLPREFLQFLGSASYLGQLIRVFFPELQGEIEHICRHGLRQDFGNVPCRQISLQLSGPLGQHAASENGDHPIAQFFVLHRGR